MYAGVAVAAVFLVILVTVLMLRKRPAPPPPPVAFLVTVRSTPEGAAIKVDDNPCGVSTCQVKLGPGSHRAEATLAGYEPATASFSIGKNGGPPEGIRLTLQQPPAQVVLSTDLTEGTLYVDGAAVAQIQGAETELPRLSPGQHVIELKASNASASLTMEFPNGAMPKLAAPIQAQGLHAVIVSKYGNQAMAYADLDGTPIAVDGKISGSTTAAGLELKDLSPGPHEVRAMVKTTNFAIPFDVSPDSGLVVSLRTESRVGILKILTGEDDVAVYLNGQKYKSNTKRGRVQVYLPAKAYKVHVEKQGLYAPDQDVTLKVGDDVQLTFQMVPAKSRLDVRGAPTATEVLLDGTSIGTAQDGSFSSANIEPGKHTVGLRKEGFKPFRAEYNFEPGKPVSIDVTLEPAPGMLTFDVTPAGVQGLLIRVVKEGETQSSTAVEKDMAVPAGTYRVTASAPQYQEASATVTVGAGRTAAVALTLVKRNEKGATPPPPTRVSLNIKEWAERDKAWEFRDQVWVKTGGEFVSAPVQPVAGTFLFTVYVVKGKRLEWFLNYRDPKNYDLFQLDDKNFTRTRFTNGKKSETVKVPRPTNMKAYVTMNITVTGSSIVHNFLVEGKPQTLDKWDVSGGGIQGKFGFHLSGSDQIAVSEFRFNQN
jgi:hypothetical protein